MSTTEHQDIVLFVPRSNQLTALAMGICLPVGLTIPFLAGWQLPALVVSLLLIIAGVFGLVLAWKLLHTPALIINEEGIYSLHPLFHSTIKWEEIDALYRINNGAMFAVDLSPAGLVSFFSRQGKPIPRRLDITVPQLALGIQAVNLSLPVDQLLVQIRERFSDKLEGYHIDLDDERGAEKVPE